MYLRPRVHKAELSAKLKGKIMFDEYGYDADGFDAFGVDRQGFDRTGRDTKGDE